MRAVLSLIVFLCACSQSPSPGLIDATKSDVSVDGRNFSVYFTDTQFEIVRHGWAAAGEHEGIRENMLAVVSQATGCRLIDRTVTGDSGVMRGSLSC